MSYTQRLSQCFFSDTTSGFSIDWSAGGLDLTVPDSTATLVPAALKELKELEAGAVANQDEQRMVGHFWLRDSGRAPSSEITADIDETKTAVLNFVSAVHSGKISAAGGNSFKYVVLAGIGGSALGPQLLETALRAHDAPMSCYYLDNTDPAGFVDTVAAIPDLSRTLCIVISKSGGTRETRNAMLWMEQAFTEAGVSPASQMVAVTQEGSLLDKHAVANQWLARFPMWDWVGGRVSLWSAVGILPAALLGIDVEGLLAGAKHMDELTRNETVAKNPALILALHWYHLGKGQGERSLVMLPYRDQLEKLSKYMQQLVMESIGKKLNRKGEVVHQGLYVLGNKGSTDQHSYVQQLRDGLDSFIAHFIEVRKDTATLSTSALQKKALAVIDEGATAGDYLLGFLQGTRAALKDAGRPSLLLSIAEVNAFSMGMLLALFERSVSFYATFIDVNAYHQPGVEAGKKAAERVLEVQRIVLEELASGSETDLAGVIERTGLEAEVDYVFAILRHLAENDRIAVRRGTTPLEDRYTAVKN